MSKTQEPLDLEAAQKSLNAYLRTGKTGDAISTMGFLIDEVGRLRASQPPKDLVWITREELGELDRLREEITRLRSLLSTMEARAPLPPPLDLDALEAYMLGAVSEKPDWPGLETAGLAWIEIIRQIKASSPYCIGCGAKLKDGPGIGPYCPNEKCDRISDQRQSPSPEAQR